MFEFIGRVFSSFGRSIRELFSGGSLYRITFNSAVDPRSLGEIEKKLSLNTRALDDGQNEIPKSETTQLGDFESGLKELYQNFSDQLYHDRKNQIEQTRSEMSGAAYEIDIHTLATNQNDAINQIRNISDQAINELSSDYQDYTERRETFEAFRTVNKLGKKRPEPTTTVSTLKKILFLILLFLGEIVLNAGFFAEGSAQGLIGGVLETVVFSLLNLGFSFLIWFIFVRNIVHHNFGRKIIGGLAFIVWFVAALGFNLLLAHYREAIISLEKYADKVALDSFMANHVDLSDTRSWILVGLGMLFSLWAGLDAYYFRDPYPGFQSVYDQMKTAEETLNDEYQDRLEELQEKSSQQETKLKQQLKLLPEIQENYQDSYERISRLKMHYVEDQQRLQKNFETLLEKYRKLNVEARRTPAPKTFEQQEYLQIHELPNESEKPDSAKDFAKKMEKSIQKIETYIKQLDDAQKTSREEILEKYKEFRI